MEIKGRLRASKFDDETFEVKGRLETLNVEKKSISWKDKVGIVQSIATVLAIIIGGFWAVHIFFKERQGFPHANISQKIEHHNIDKNIILVRVSVDIANTGTSLMVLKNTTQSLQQIIPTLGCPKEGKCAPKQINSALKRINIDEDRFSWPVISRRISSLHLNIEPGENEVIDFEFVIPSYIQLIRVYSYFINDSLSSGGDELGWTASSIYNLNYIKEDSNEN